MSQRGRSRTFIRALSLHPKTIADKTVALLLIPVLSLLALWVLATATAAQQAWNSHRSAQLSRALAPPVDRLIDALQNERDAVSLRLSVPGTGPGNDSTRRDTEAAAKALRTAVEDTDPAEPVAQRAHALLADTDTLQDHRSEWPDAYSTYGDAIEDGLALSDALASAHDGQAAQHARVAVTFNRIDETLQRQGTAAGAALFSGRLTIEEHQAFAEALGGQRTLTAALLTDLSPAQSASYRRHIDSVPYRTLTGMQDSLLTGGQDALPGISPQLWQDSVGQLLSTVEQNRAEARAAEHAAADAQASAAIDRAIWTAVLGMLAVILAVLISMRIARGMVRDLVGLRDSALQLADERLPRAMQRIRAGEKVDDVPEISGGDGEIGEVGAALNAVQHSALNAAAERAELLTDVSGAFMNLARRSQSLVHRQIELLDTMRKHATDPADQGDLLRLGALATRMRRHAEGLIIMSGTTPGRTRRDPEPLVDVLRAAAGDIEDHARVDVGRMPEVSVLGPAVADVTRLFTELTENATLFSPPDSTVLVRGGKADEGVVVEVEDHGLGIPEDKLTEVNNTLREGYRLEIFDSDRIGLFVVSRLAHRQGVSVSLRGSEATGTIAEVRLPMSILAPTGHQGTAEETPKVVDSVRVAERPAKVWTEPGETTEEGLPKRKPRSKSGRPPGTSDDAQLPR